MVPVDLENVAQGHPDVASCVIGVAHPKWMRGPFINCRRR